MSALLTSRSAAQQKIALPGGQILDRMLRLIMAGTGGGIIYGVATRASVTGCSTVAPADGEGTGQALTDCVAVTMEPSGWVYLLMALTAIVLASRALYNSPNEATAAALLRTAGLVVGLIPVAAWLISLAMFMMIDPTGSEAGQPPSIFVPFADIEVDLQG
ncbi:hypothetical protein [Zhihengliuella flava]|uniref:Uncharacterized protein n=1 Tax=Zhihengliuella flava TaxID=1285193 RepID=A0A931D631_9MICC|nr:hypothetical protein [Zhihengliuella flava]MBG6084385.1 hypothetical protein [Zhihengliuella flava]